MGATDLVDLTTARQSMIVVQELMEGGDLKALLLQQMATPFTAVYSKPDALRWATQVAEALHYLHSVCKPMIIHRCGACRAGPLSWPACSAQLSKAQQRSSQKCSCKQPDVQQAAGHDCSAIAVGKKPACVHLPQYRLPSLPSLLRPSCPPTL